MTSGANITTHRTAWAMLTSLRRRAAKTWDTSGPRPDSRMGVFWVAPPLPRGQFPILQALGELTTLPPSTRLFVYSKDLLGSSSMNTISRRDHPAQKMAARRATSWALTAGATSHARDRSHALMGARADHATLIA